MYTWGKAESSSAVVVPLSTPAKGTPARWAVSASITVSPQYRVRSAGAPRAGLYG